MLNYSYILIYTKEFKHFYFFTRYKNNKLACAYLDDSAKGGNK